MLSLSLSISGNISKERGIALSSITRAFGTIAANNRSLPS
jgi:hypothetical protein